MRCVVCRRRAISKALGCWVVLGLGIWLAQGAHGQMPGRPHNPPPSQLRQSTPPGEYTPTPVPLPPTSIAPNGAPRAQPLPPQPGSPPPAANADGAQDSLTAYMRQGLMHYSRGKYLDALASFDTVVQAQPTNAQARYYRGLCLAKNGLALRGSRDLLAAHLASPMVAEYAFQLGVLYSRVGANDSARWAYGQALAAEPGHVEARLARAILNHRAGEPALAADDLREALRHDHRQPKFWLMLGLFELEAGRLDSAEAALDVYMANQAGELEARLLKAKILIAKGEYLKAELLLDEAMVNAPTNPELFMQRGVARAKQGATSSALYDFDRSLQLDPTYAPTYLERGRFHLHQSRYDEAIADLTAALKRDRTLLEALVLRGQAHARRFNLAAACADWELAAAQGSQEGRELWAQRCGY